MADILSAFNDLISVLLIVLVSCVALFKVMAVAVSLEMIPSKDSPFFISTAQRSKPLDMERFRLLAATGQDREAARVFDQQVTMPLTASSVLGTLERGRTAERLGDLVAMPIRTGLW